jgi:pimeloyl-ACP methyl ester carboxylesterase
MVGPSITADDRERFLVQLKIGFALLVGLSMGLVTLYGGAGLPIVLGVAIGTTVVGGLLAEFTFPDSLAETPYKESLDRGPKPGKRTQRRREREQEQDEKQRATDGDGR